mmetsp:Transcript_7697/g.10080  ORF Transcript_7697/g.10080 Transcript_7697/m.10080 type:complete len:225 (-) Transcript_7697:79-753(-)|eukprot:CAMPEP_0198146942 /NCGR_PEP_ID=MMETSP1443-20131203/32412_1 /TAXON_ID=186043 /ORGANISM="Entomoneis sp., Strain CCMP2396" /LENGTH=224 /DNA_ID=CAMNT_0043811059 /DNA_START=87 /DNA_END=761 /DNA_ORIENTATION=-
MNAREMINSFLFGSYEIRKISDDECSLSSTISVESQHKALSLPITAERRIRFNLSANVSHDNTLYPEEDSPSHWLNAEDYQYFKTSNSTAARAIQNVEGGDDPNPLTYSGVMHNTYLACSSIGFDVETSVLSTKDEIELKQLFRHDRCMDRIGLERKAVKPVSASKTFKRRELVRIIYSTQLAENWNDFDTMSDVLRSRCEGVSRASRLFARHLAQAQLAVSYD